MYSNILCSSKFPELWNTSRTLPVLSHAIWFDECTVGVSETDATGLGRVNVESH